MLLYFGVLSRLRSGWYCKRPTSLNCAPRKLNGAMGVVPRQTSQYPNFLRNREWRGNEDADLIDYQRKKTNHAAADSPQHRSRGHFSHLAMIERLFVPPIIPRDHRNSDYLTRDRKPSQYRQFNLGHKLRRLDICHHLTKL